MKNNIKFEIGEGAQNNIRPLLYLYYLTIHVFHNEIKISFIL
jgi:hypothetical protein